jgi:dTDP-4-dehydrorhamnose 3,5-epimerase
MKVITTGFEGLHILEPQAFSDERGFFMEAYNKLTLENHGIHHTFIQDNESFSKKGVLRGLHFQKEPHAQTKLVRTLQGNILDAVVDLRKAQPTFGKSFSIELSGQNRKQLLVPKGFAHAFVVLSETASVLYKCDAYYNKASEGGIRFDDSELNIDWVLPKDKLIVSAKDMQLPYLKNLAYHF